MSKERVEALILGASSSLGLRNCGKMEARDRMGKENVAHSTNDNSVAGKRGESRWRSKALAALSQLSSLQQRASAAELKACELQLTVDQATLTTQSLDTENGKLRVLLAEVQEERDQLMLEVRLRNAKTSRSAGNQRTTSNVENTERAVTKDAVHETDGTTAHTIHDLTSQLHALRIVHEETKLENETLLFSQQGLKEHVTALQERIARLQDENDYFSSFREEDIIPQEEDVNHVYGVKGHDADLRAQLQDRESELLELYETLDEERERSKELRDQCARQSEELGSLRERVHATKRVERELAALKLVHADTLEKVITLQMLLGRDDGFEEQGACAHVSDS